MLLRHPTRLRQQARLAHLPDGKQQVVHLTCREVEILRLISQRVDDLELLVEVEGGVEGAVGGGGGDGQGHALVDRRERVLKRIIKLHVPVSLGAVGVRYDGGVVTRSHHLLSLLRSSLWFPHCSWRICRVHPVLT